MGSGGVGFGGVVFEGVVGVGAAVVIVEVVASEVAVVAEVPGVPRLETSSAVPPIPESREVAEPSVAARWQTLAATPDLLRRVPLLRV